MQPDPADVTVELFYMAPINELPHAAMGPCPWLVYGTNENRSSVSGQTMRALFPVQVPCANGCTDLSRYPQEVLIPD